MSEAIEELTTQRLPHNLEAERALLGSLILDNRQFGVAQEVLPNLAVQQALKPPPRHRGEPEPEPLFFLRAHQQIFSAMIALYEEKQGFDLTTLAEGLEQRGQLESVGGSPALAGLEDDIFSLGQVAQLAAIVGQKWRLRCLIRAAHGIIDEATGAEAEAQEVIDRSEKLIFDIAQEHDQRDFVHLADVIHDQLIEIEQRSKGGDELPGLNTGLTELNNYTSGLRPSNLIILAARPSMGKTALAMNIAANAAIKEHRPVGIFSIEMSIAELTQRLLCSQAHVSLRRVREGRSLGRNELEALHEAGEKIHQAPLFIDDTSSLTMLEMRSRARRLKAQNPGLALLVVDYLQLMSSGASRVESRQQEVSEISRSLKSLARELEVPVLAVSQLSRQSEQRRGTKERLPRLSDLRESGAIEQDADVVLFIHRERNLEKAEERSNEPDLATVIVGKQRNGPTGRFDVFFQGEFMRFADLAHPSREY